MSFVRTFSAVSLFCQVSEVHIQKDSQTAGEMNLFQILITAAAQQALCKQAFDLGTGDRKLLGQKFISSDFQVMRILDMDHPAVFGRILPGDRGKCLFFGDGVRDRILPHNSPVFLKYFLVSADFQGKAAVVFLEFLIQIPGQFLRADALKNSQIVGGSALFALVDQPDIHTFSIGVDAEIPGTLKQGFCAAFRTVSDDFIGGGREYGPGLLF